MKKLLVLNILMFSLNLISWQYPNNCPRTGYGIGTASDYQQYIKAYVFPFECPKFYDDNGNPMPEEKRELQENDIIYKDEECLAIVLERFPCYCSQMGIEEWVFEYEEADGTTTSGRIIHDPNLAYPNNGWITFGIYWQYGQPLPCFMSDQWHGIKFYQTKSIHCEKNEQKFGMWRLRFKYCSSAWGGECNILREWNVEFRNVDRGRLKLTLPDNPESILPDGLEVEPNTQAGGDTTRLNLYFETCDGPVQNQSISFRQKFINGTGGHNHEEPPECGAMRTHPTCGSITPSTVTTNRRGNAEATYTAPIYSGGSEIKAVTDYNGYEREAKEKIYHVVEGLSSVSSQGLFLVLPDNQICIHGNANNFLSGVMFDHLNNFITVFNTYCRFDQSPLYMTAGSLPAGGKFDDGPTCWATHRSRKHLYHRQGLDVDLDYVWIVNNIDSGPDILRECLKMFCAHCRLYDPEESDTHAHFRLR